MPDFHIVQDPNPLTFDDAKKAFSLEMREGLARAAARGRIPEDDPFWGLLVALTELSNTGLEAQSNLIKAILEQFVSARSAENKEYAARLAAHEAATREMVAAIRTAVASNERASEGLLQEVCQNRDETNKMLADVERKFSCRAVEVIAAANKGAHKADLLKAISEKLIWSAIGAAVLLGFLLDRLVALLGGWGR